MMNALLDSQLMLSNDKVISASTLQALSGTAFGLSASIHGSSPTPVSAHLVRCEVLNREINGAHRHRVFSYFEAHSRVKAPSLAFQILAF